jgi:hypothetical protein
MSVPSEGYGAVLDGQLKVSVTIRAGFKASQTHTERWIGRRVRMRHLLNHQFLSSVLRFTKSKPTEY